MSRAEASEELLGGANRALVLADDRIRVTLLPDRGGDIHSVLDLRTGVDVLWKTPWGLHIRDNEAPLGSPAAWLNSYAGGWQVLIPSGGGPSSHGGVDHPYHGEACSLPWAATVATDANGGEHVDLRVRLAGSPLLIERTVSLTSERGEVVLRERVMNEGDRPVDYIWVHHPAFGSPLVAPGARIRTSASMIMADPTLDGPANPLEPGSSHAWPVVSTRDGRRLDLSRIPEPPHRRLLLGYLSGFVEGAVSIENDVLDLACTLTWQLDVFPYAWLWQEFGSTTGAPWFGRAFTMAIEPATSFPASGLGSVVETTATHRTLAAGAAVETELRLRLSALGTTHRSSGDNSIVRPDRAARRHPPTRCRAPRRRRSPESPSARSPRTGSPRSRRRGTRRLARLAGAARVFGFGRDPSVAFTTGKGAIPYARANIRCGEVSDHESKLVAHIDTDSEDSTSRRSSGSTLVGSSTAGSRI